MGGHKTHRKNEERKRRQKSAEERQTCLEDSSLGPEMYTVSLPMSVYLGGTVSKVADLSSRLLNGHCSNACQPSVIMYTYMCEGVFYMCMYCFFSGTSHCQTWCLESKSNYIPIFFLKTRTLLRGLPA